MNGGKIILTGLLSAVFVSSVAAQGRGQGGGAQGGVQGGGAGGPVDGQRGPVDARGGQPSPGQRQGTGIERRDRIQATDQQREQHADCTRAADRVRERARELAQVARAGGANNPEFRRLHQQLHEEIRVMQQERDRFINSLSAEQRSTLENRFRNMDKARDRLNERLRLLDDEFAKPELDQKRIRSRASDVDKAMNEWQKQYRNTGSDIGIQAQ